jgi:DNA-binding NtrC family response regulator
LITVDVRIITASNRPLESLVAQKLFREDLFYRVRVFPILIPPLRDRPEDIDPLIDWFLSRLPGELKKKSVEFVLEDQARDRMRRYPWPGNVRELRNCLERAIILSESGRIEERHLRLSPEPASPPASSGEETLEEVRERGAKSAERLWLARALEKARGDRTAAAEALKISPRRLEAKLKEHSLDR